MKIEAIITRARIWKLAHDLEDFLLDHHQLTIDPREFSMQLDAILIEEGRGAILASKGEGPQPTSRILLPFVFDSRDLASKFLCACERSGVNLWPGMSHDEITKLYRLWHDSFKRPD